MVANEPRIAWPVLRVCVCGGVLLHDSWLEKENFKVILYSMLLWKRSQPFVTAWVWSRLPTLLLDQTQESGVDPQALNQSLGPQKWLPSPADFINTTFKVLVNNRPWDLYTSFSVYQNNTWRTWNHPFHADKPWSTDKINTNLYFHI